MVFRATSYEIASVLKLSSDQLIKSGCRGVATSVEDLQSGMLFVDLSPEAQMSSAAFAKGASLLLVASDASLSKEEKEYALIVKEPEEALWLLFQWWREREEYRFIAIVGEPPFTSWLQEVSAHYLLSKEKGFYRGARFSSGASDNECRLASEILNSQEQSAWYLVALAEEMKRLLLELKPLKVFRESDLKPAEDSSEESFTYMQGGKVGYLSPEVSLAGWPIPMKSSARLVTLVKEISDSLNITYTEDEMIELGARFFPPPYLGFYSSLGEVGAIWVERASSPCRAEVELLLQYRDEMTIAFLVEDEVGVDALVGFEESAPIFLWPTEEGAQISPQKAITVSSFNEVLDALMPSSPFFLIAFISEEERGDHLFHMRDELYNLAQGSEGEEEET